MTPELVERFHAAIEYDPNGGCWLWSGYTVSGYGVIGQKESKTKAHRFSYELHRGTIPRGLVVCHKCDVRACVNPEHLFLGTLRDNIMDMVAKGRHAAARRGKDSLAAKLTEQQVIEIRRRAREGETDRAIAASIGVSKSAIGRVRRREVWVEVP